LILIGDQPPRVQMIDAIFSVRLLFPLQGQPIAHISGKQKQGRGVAILAKA
jgi:hypothetical protein